MQESAEQLEERYGKILSCLFLEYDKYTFTLLIQCEKFPDTYFEMTTGGNSTTIYRYNPLTLDWAEHRGAEILWINESE